jgi:hypothetical protein
METGNKDVERQGLKTQQTGRRIGAIVWVIILSVYLALFSMTGYIAFFIMKKIPQSM